MPPQESGSQAKPMTGNRDEGYGGARPKTTDITNLQGMYARPRNASSYILIISDFIPGDGTCTRLPPDEESEETMEAFSQTSPNISRGRSGSLRSLRKSTDGGKRSIQEAPSKLRETEMRDELVYEQDRQGHQQKDMVEVPIEEFENLKLTRTLFKRMKNVLKFSPGKKR